MGSTQTRGKTRGGEEVRTVPRLAVDKATGAYVRQSALGLLPLGGDSESQREKSELAYRRGEKVSLEKREAVLRRCRSSRQAVNQLRAAYWLPAAGRPAFRMEVAAAKMRVAL